MDIIFNINIGKLKEIDIAPKTLHAQAMSTTLPDWMDSKPLRYVDFSGRLCGVLRYIKMKGWRGYGKP
jgi:hypothetical protein